MISDNEILREGISIFAMERAALLYIENNLGENFIHAVRKILETKGNVIISGVGKSGHVGRKIAATLSSTGTTSYFVHADEAAHGDLGMIRKGDIFIGISFSGESEELMLIIPALKSLGVPIIGITGKSNSSLARVSDIPLITPISREACPLNLAPTTSTTVTMVLGDAIAGALMVAKDFDKDDFARSHPAGALGRRLLLQVRDVMRHKNDCPVVSRKSSVFDAIATMAKYHLGCFIVANDKDQVSGIFTEGDLTRLIRSKKQLSPLYAENIMVSSPVSINVDASAYEAMQEIRKHGIHQLVVLDDDKFVGLVHIQDLIRFKIS